MRRTIPFYLRFFVTMLTVLISGIVLFIMVRHYLLFPWTRNAQLQAKVIQLTSHVSGHVIELPVHDNQLVHKGDLLWKVDPRTFEADVELEKSSLKKAIAAEDEARDIATRVRHLYKLDINAISELKRIKVENDLRQATAAVNEEKASLNNAQVKLKYTQMYAPATGYVTNLKIYLGSYLTENEPVLALIDSESFWVQAFFKETLLHQIKPGDKAIIKMMTYPGHPLEGVVDSIGWGIAKQDGSAGVDLLPSINPTFDWIRLAQRVSVRIHVTKIPDIVKLRVGSTATVIILPVKKSK